MLVGQKLLLIVGELEGVDEAGDRYKYTGVGLESVSVDAGSYHSKGGADLGATGVKLDSVASLVDDDGGRSDDLFCTRGRWRMACRVFGQRYRLVKADTVAVGELSSVDVHLVPCIVDARRDIFCPKFGREVLRVIDIVIVLDTAILSRLEIVAIERQVGLIALLEDRTVKCEAEL